VGLVFSDMSLTPLALAGGRALPSKAARFHVCKGQIRPCKPCGIAGVLLPSPDDDVAIARIALDRPAMPPGLLDGDDRRARAGKRIEDDGSTSGDVPNRIGHERRRLCLGMAGNIFARRQTADRRIFPDVGPPPAVLTRAYLGLVESGDSLGSLDERVWRHRFDFWRAIDAETLFFGLARACA
jgi:hypothetical protein